MRAWSRHSRWHAHGGRESGFGPALPVAFAGACACAGVARRRAVAAFAYTRLAATVSAAMRLIAIGQSEAHAILARTLDRVPEVVEEIAAPRRTHRVVRAGSGRCRDDAAVSCTRGSSDRKAASGLGGR